MNRNLMISAIGILAMISMACSQGQSPQTSSEAEKKLPLTAPGGQVTYFDKDTVAAAFAKGVVLYDGAGVNYSVNAGRRTEPGLVEVHTKETDVFHILEGSATFVTGGKMIDGKETAPDQFRGRAIEGGQARRLSKGDVIIIPAGIPHWFKEVDGVVLYFVVKVR